MKFNPRLIILVLVILAVGVVFAVPYLDSDNKSQGEDLGDLGPIPTKFATTDRPAEKLRLATEQGRPAFLEFYAKW